VLSLLSYRGYKVGVWAIYALGIIWVMLSFIPGSGFLIDNSGRGIKPPVAYRVLVRKLHDVTYHAIPLSAEKAMMPTIQSIRDNKHVKRLLHMDPKRGVPYNFTNDRVFFALIKLVWTVIWFVAFIAMLGKLARALFPRSEACALVAPLLFLWLLPTLFHRYAYTYDFAELFFACACMYLLFIQKWWWYIGSFVLATLTKETSVFMIVFFAIWYLQRMPKSLYLQLLILQVVLYGLIETIIIASYTSVAYTHGGEGLQTFWRLFQDQLHYMHGYNFYTLMAGIGMLVLFSYRWKEKPGFLLGCLWMALANVVIYLFCCNDGEYRDLFWSMPAMVLLATHSVVTVMDMDEWPLFRHLQTLKA
jgi:hypothetical protein